MKECINKITPEAFNLLAVLFSGLMAHFAPMELLFVSYAVLGPAHYLTEISWLHERNYFSHKNLFWAFGFLTLLLFANQGATYSYVFISLLLAGVLVLARSLVTRLVVISIGISLLYFMPQYKPLIILSVLITTLIHVLVFTFLFILSGYQKRESKLDLITMILIILFITSFFIVPYDSFNFSLFNDTNNFLKTIQDSLIELMGLTSSPKLLNQILKLTAFSYTFHYLNWFGKTSLLGLNKLSLSKKINLTLCYVFFLGLYFYDYQVGFTVVAFLSVFHVVLEFPLNIIVIRSLFSRN